MRYRCDLWPRWASPVTVGAFVTEVQSTELLRDSLDCFRIGKAKQLSLTALSQFVNRIVNFEMPNFKKFRMEINDFGEHSMKLN